MYQCITNRLSKTPDECVSYLVTKYHPIKLILYGLPNANIENANLHVDRVFRMADIDYEIINDSTTTCDVLFECGVEGRYYILKDYLMKFLCVQLVYKTQNSITLRFITLYNNNISHRNAVVDNNSRGIKILEIYYNSI